MITKTFVDEIFDIVINQKAYLHVDMSNVEKITAAAVLYLASVVNVCQNCAPKELAFSDQAITFQLPVGAKKSSLFIETGLWDIIKPGGQKKLQRLWEDSENPFKTGNDPEREYPELLKWLARQGFTPPPKLASAVQEAYLNIKQHAYDKNTVIDKFLISRWWQYAYVDEGAGRFNFLLYDHGVGIPGTVKGEKFGYMRDERKLETAMTEGWTSTKEPGRGRGSANMQQPIAIKKNDDTLLIMSGRGKYVFKNDEVEQVSALPATLKGTLVEWSLALK
ncbi:hypothetical protein E2F43_18215 [Seongchinamella unica]|uniref:Uncharacterized protein n=1 Tax=Seongchinamella unica TaxID=2547392 RepID=A0A4R5LN62_9GAMM|nr:hypothetical protein [Seongchinamella unica]TDG11646.1 hypothetical protein E2F43_18215 [Seongchinamella unica]